MKDVPIIADTVIVTLSIVAPEYLTSKGVQSVRAYCSSPCLTTIVRVASNPFKQTSQKQELNLFILYLPDMAVVHWSFVMVATLISIWRLISTQEIMKIALQLIMKFSE